MPSPKSGTIKNIARLEQSRAQRMVTYKVCPMCCMRYTWKSVKIYSSPTMDHCGFCSQTCTERAKQGLPLICKDIK
jgi:hypothetical protein